MFRSDYLDMIQRPVYPRTGRYGGTEGQTATFRCRYHSQEGPLKTVDVDAWNYEQATEALAAQGIRECDRCGKWCEASVQVLEEGPVEHHCGLCVLEKPARYVNAGATVTWADVGSFERLTVRVESDRRWADRLAGGVR